MANLSPTSGVAWTQNHGFAIGAEVDFTFSGDALDWTADIPFSIGGVQVFGGNINYNMNGVNGRSTALVRMAIQGDVAGGDAGGGPGSVLLVNKALYVVDDLKVVSELMPFAIQLDNRRLPVPTDGSAYKFHITISSAGAIYPAHMEIALAGMWWDTSEAPPAGI